MKRLLAVLLLTAACSSEKPPIADEQPQKPAPPPPPTAQQARELIAASAELGDFEFTNAGFTTPVSGAAMSPPVRQSVKELAEAGWVSLDTNGDVSLNDKSRSDKRFLMRPNGLLDIVPLAKKEMGDVTSVHANPDGTASAEFTWKWLPNEVGTAFRTGPVHDRFAAGQDGRATFIWDGTSWGVLEIQ
jgi:hypothetical protein